MKNGVEADRKRNESRDSKTAKLMNAEAPDLWKSFNDHVLKACVELCGKKIATRDRGDIWWWNEEVKNVIATKGNIHRAVHARMSLKKTMTDTRT